jgi:putative PIN family toxin of toxin-antitoxin system
MAKITLDTSVLYQALRSTRGASYQILQLIRQKKLRVTLTVPVFFEYQEVLYRPETLRDLELTRRDVDAVLDLLLLHGELHVVSFLWRPNLADADDDLFVECAVVGQSDFLITRNVRDFTSGELRPMVFAVATPTDFYRQWRKDHG